MPSPDLSEAREPDDLFEQRLERAPDFVESGLGDDGLYHTADGRGFKRTGWICRFDVDGALAGAQTCCFTEVTDA